jgi:hypothetical protein
VSEALGVLKAKWSDAVSTKCLGLRGEEKGGRHTISLGFEMGTNDATRVARGQGVQFCFLFFFQISYFS